MALLCFANFSKAEDVSIDDFTIKQGETIKVALTLTNTHSDLTAFSMTLTLPSGLKLIEAEATDRYDGSIVIGSPDTNMFIAEKFYSGILLRRICLTVALESSGS